MAQITIPTWSKERSPTGWALSFHVKCKFAERTWGIELRYSQLQRLHIKLLTLIPTVPGRKALADRFPKQSALRLQFLEPSIPQINRRRIELERYLQYVAEHAPPRVANEMTKVLVAAGKLDMQTRRSWPRQMDSVFVPPETHSTEDACPEDGEEWEFVDGADAGASAQSVQSAPREPARTASAMLSPADIEAILSQLEAEARQAEARLVQAAAEPGTQQLMRADRDDGVAAMPQPRTHANELRPQRVAAADMAADEALARRLQMQEWDIPTTAESSSGPRSMPSAAAAPAAPTSRDPSAGGEHPRPTHEFHFADSLFHAPSAAAAGPSNFGSDQRSPIEDIWVRNAPHLVPHAYSGAADDRGQPFMRSETADPIGSHRRHPPTMDPLHHPSSGGTGAYWAGLGAPAPAHAGPTTPGMTQPAAGARTHFEAETFVEGYPSASSLINAARLQTSQYTFGAAGAASLIHPSLSYEQLVALESVRRGVSAAALDNLPISSFREVPGEAVDCMVCLEALVDADEIRDLPCRHIYHRVCIDMWLEAHTTCPLCKRDFGSHEF